MRLRIAIGAVGVAAGVYGAWLFLHLPFAKLVDAVLFLAGGVALHDALVAPLTIVGTVLLTRVVPARWRRQVTVGLVVLLTVTVATLPAILRLGARPDNATLLPRNYLAGWLVLVAVVLVATLAVPPVVRRLRSTSRG